MLLSWQKLTFIVIPKQRVMLSIQRFDSSGIYELISRIR